MGKRTNQTEESAKHRRKRRWTMGELMQMPPAKRDAILRAAAAKAEFEYLNNPDLTDFEAFGDNDLFVDSSNDELG